MAHIIESTHSRNLYMPWLQLIQDQGDVVETRGRTTRELLDCISVVTEPWHHCILLPSRRWNPWLALSEALWILAGRNDVAVLKPYNSHIGDYSDNGNTLYGAYGARIYGQIDPLIERLQKDSNDRRAVLQIWDNNGKPYKSSNDINEYRFDLTTDSKDPPCLSGDTIVYSPEGNRSIKDFIGTKIPVYTLNEETNHREIKFATGIKKGIKPVLRITFDDGSVIKATEDHLFHKMERKKTISDTHSKASHIYRSWVKASELMPGDSLTPIHFVTGNKGHISFYQDITQNWNGKNRKAVHREYWEFLNGPRPIGYDIHHENHISDDNRSENLILIKHGYHSQHHRSTAIGKPTKSRAGLRKTRTDKRDWQAEELLELGKSVLQKYGHIVWWRFNQEYKGIVSGTVVQGRFGSWSNFVSIVTGNHKVASIEECGEEEVFDLQVDDNHNFFVAPGVLVHNCNNLIYFKLRHNKLHMTVMCRSNDLHWGLFAVNLPTFGILQSYIAARLGVEMGTQTHLSNSLHIYTDDKRAVDITDRMLYKESEDMPKYPEHSLAFENLQVSKHQEFAERCSAVLEDVYVGSKTAEVFPFLVFARYFLRAYRERDLEIIARAPYRERYQDWILAGNIFAEKMWK